MDDKYRGLASASFKLLVGPNQDELHVPQEVLTRIPYFKKALRDNPESESRKRQLQVPDFHHATLADAIYFSWIDRVTRVPVDEASGEPIPGMQMAATRVLTYVVAHRLGLDRVCDQIESVLKEYYNNFYADPRQLLILHNANLQNGTLWEVFIETMGEGFANEPLEVMCERLPFIESGLELLPQKVLLELWKSRDQGP